MKFKDLKLPGFAQFDTLDEMRKGIARAVYDQMREHYEAKLSEANKCPQELLEYVQQFFKVAQQGREAGERLRAAIGKDKPDVATTNSTAPEWRLPDPPPGQQWHRDDWTHDMLVDAEGNQYRPLVDMEPIDDAHDQMFCDGRWVATVSDGGAVFPFFKRHRTRRPLPTPVEYVPLGPEDVPPGSAVRHMSNGVEWEAVQAVLPGGVCAAEQSRILWRTLFDQYEILRPGSTAWEPCKKPKA